jgi:hypothetical protein
VRFVQVGPVVWTLCLQTDRRTDITKLERKSYNTGKDKIVSAFFLDGAPCYEGVLGDRRNNSTHSWPRYPLDRRLSVWTSWRREKFPSPAWTRIPDNPARSLALYHWAIPVPVILQNGRKAISFSYSQVRRAIYTNRVSALRTGLLGLCVGFCERTIRSVNGRYLIIRGTLHAHIGTDHIKAIQLRREEWIDKSTDERS